MDAIEQLEHEVRSEEVQDIVDRMPTRVGTWVIALLVSIVSIGVGICWFVEYPDVIIGEVTINSSHPPVRIVANANGALELLVKARQQVTKDELIAIIKNSASAADVMSLKKLLDEFHAAEDGWQSQTINFPRNLTLGDIELKYIAFWEAYTEMQRFLNDNIHEKELSDTRDLQSEQLRSLNQKKALLSIREDNLQLAANELNANSNLFKKKIISKSQFEQIKANFLQVRESVVRIENEIIDNEIRLKELQSRSGQVQIEGRKSSTETRLRLFSAYKDLRTAISVWEQRYALLSPINGNVEYLQFWNNDQFVTNGQEVFSVASQQTDFRGEVYLPSTGLGRIKVNQKASIQLEDYPANEFGFIQGTVKTISSGVSTVRNSEGKNASVNLIVLKLKHQEKLITSRGNQLKYKNGMNGRVEIITENKRLLERFFETVRRITESKE